MQKLIVSYEEAKPKIKNAVSLIADPVIQTLSPRGGNVMFEDQNGMVTVTNDGVTIAKHIQSNDPLEDKIIDAIKFAALRSNKEAGDGTTTATLLTKVMIEESMRLLDNGMSRLELKELLDKMSGALLENLKEYRLKAETEEQLRRVALISASGDEEIADNVVKIFKDAGQDGMVIIETNHKPDTEVITEPGFALDQPLAFRELAQRQGNSSRMDDVAVLVTDKRLYYEEEAETILTTALQAGHKKLVVVASDFIGKTPNFFLANHLEGVIELILIKESDAETLDDLATYLGGSVVSEKSGSLVNNLTAEQFITATRVLSNASRSFFTSSNPSNKRVAERIEFLRGRIEEEEEPSSYEKRLSGLTNGTVTVRVGGNSPLEIQERAYRYDDAINAVRNAEKHGYVVGGGLTLLKLLEADQWAPEHLPTIQRYCEASVRQIAKNSDKHPDTVIEMTNTEEDYGYNAKTNSYGHLYEAGVIDPYTVTEMAIANSLSVTKAIMTSAYFVVNVPEEKE